MLAGSVPGRQAEARGPKGESIADVQAGAAHKRLAGGVGVTAEGVMRAGEMPAKGQLSIGTWPYAQGSGRADAKPRDHGKGKPGPRLPFARKAAQGTFGTKGKLREKSPGTEGGGTP
jgi:hypothetical protein